MSAVTFPTDPDRTARPSMSRLSELVLSLARRTALVPLAAMAVTTTASAAESDPREGDAKNGARLFRLHCASCHGPGALGDGPLADGLEVPPENLRDGGYLWAHTDEDFIRIVTGGGPAAGHSAAMPAFGCALTALEQRDILEWLRIPVPTLNDFFPEAVDYIAHEHELDVHGIERAEQALNRKLKDDEKSIRIYTMFKADPAEKAANQAPPAQRIEEVPQALYTGKPKRKIGFVGYVTLQLDGGKVLAGLALDRDMELVKVVTAPGHDVAHERLRSRVAPILNAYVGSGNRIEKRPVRPHRRGVVAPKDVQREMLRAFTLVLEGAAMYEKEERDRFWADPDAYKMPEAADFGDVKFQMKRGK